MSDMDTIHANNEIIEANNNTINDILDTISLLPDGTGGVLDVYSEEEKKINKVWIDGKPIYRKVIKFTNGLNTGVNSFQHNIPSIDSITNVQLLMKFGTSFYINSAYESTANFLSLCAASTTDIFIAVGSGWGNSFKQGFTIIMEYTKTE